MKYIYKISNLGKLFALTAGLLLLTFLLFTLLYFIVNLINNQVGNLQIYFWEKPISMVFTIIVVLALWFRVLEKNYSQRDTDSVTTWIISILVVIVISLYFLNNAYKKSLLNWSQWKKIENYY